MSPDKSQLELFNFPPISILYFALRPPDVEAQAIWLVARDQCYRNGARRPLPAENLHISTNGIGQFPADVDQVIQAGQAVRGSPFEVVFDRLLSFRNGRQYPVVLSCDEGSAGVVRLRAAIAAELQRRGLPADTGPFTPHLTLWYGQAPLPTQMLPRPFCWTVTDFWLIRTVYGTGRQKPEGHWTLH